MSKISYEATAQLFCSFKDDRLNLIKNNKLYQTFFHNETRFSATIIIIIIIIVVVVVIMNIYYGSICKYNGSSPYKL